MTQVFPPRAVDYGYPDLTEYEDGWWVPDLRAAISAHRDQIDRIASNSDSATVENTLSAFGRAGAELEAVQRAFSCVYAANATKSRQAVYAETAPLLAAHQDWLVLHSGFNARLGQLQRRLDLDEVQATEEQRWMLTQLQLNARTAGADLEDGSRKELMEINQRLSAEETAYQQLQTRESAQRALYIEHRDQLEGLSDAEVDSAAAAAQRAGYQSGWLLTLSMPVQQPALARLRDRQTRQRLYEASAGRGSLPDEQGFTTYQRAASIALLRAQKARLLGYENYLESVIPTRTAPSRQAVETLLKTLASGASVRLEHELEHIAAVSGMNDELRPWDISHWIHRLSSEQRATGEGTDSDFPLPLSAVLQRVFDAAHRVYGVVVVERGDLPEFAPGARAFEVFDGEAGPAGQGLGLFLLDVHSRPTKSGGAWMNAFSISSTLTGTHPVVINCLNVDPPAPGHPAMITAASQKTLFHEFGHALHALLGEAEFPQLAGTAVPRDNVEFPSQVNEVFQDLYASSTIAAGAVPEESQLWGRGHSTVEHLCAVVIDLAWHTLSPAEAEEVAADPQAFEEQALRRWGLSADLVPPRYSSGFFKHIFASSGYAAGYYSYLWAEVLAKDASEWFREVIDAPDLLRERGAAFRKELLSRGNTREPLESFRCAIGHDPQSEPLLRSLGLHEEA